MSMAMASEAEMPSKPVLDILAAATTTTATTGVPDIFTREATTGNRQLAANTSALPWIDCPVIDFSLLSSPFPYDTVAMDQELTKLHSALASWGSFQLINHGMTDSFLDEVREVSREFFKLPLEERMKYSRKSNNPEGYGNDTVLSQSVPHNWNDRLYLTVYPEEQRKLHFWPQTPLSFRGILEEFSMEVQVMNEGIVQAMAKCLGLEKNGFRDEYGEKVVITARLNFYPPCPFPELVRASRAHSDASGVTILLQDQLVEGLQVHKDDKWYKVPILPNALFINVGDQLEIMSNGIFKSPVHRVVANSEKERLSIAMFCSPENDKEIGPLKKLVNEEQPPKYKTIKRYSEIFFRHHPYGERPIEAVKI